jgi:DNA-binding MarR family transcriptional regulator
MVSSGRPGPRRGRLPGPGRMPGGGQGPAKLPIDETVWLHRIVQVSRTIPVGIDIPTVDDDSLDRPSAARDATIEPDSARPPSRGDLERLAIAELRASIGRLRCLTAQRLVGHGVSLAHLQLLQLLEAHGELTMTQVAEVVGVSMSNATGLVDRMADRGLVERHRSAADRRVVHVHISPAGRDVLADMDAVREDPLRAVLARLDDAELARLVRAAADMSRASELEVSARLGAPTPSSCLHSGTQSRGGMPVEPNGVRARG